MPGTRRPAAPIRRRTRGTYQNPQVPQAGEDEQAQAPGAYQQQEARAEQLAQIPQDQAQAQPAPQAPQQAPAQHADSYRWAPGRTRLGIAVEPMSGELRAYFGASPDRGVLVTHVASHSPAEQAGLHVGDVITYVDGRMIQDADDVRSAIGERNDTAVRLEVLRHGTPMHVQVALGFEHRRDPGKADAVDAL